MLKIINGSLGEAKKELQKILKVKQKQVSDIKQRYPAKQRTPQVLNDIKEIEYFLRAFGVSVMLPVQIDDVVINFKLYEKIIKKLSGFTVEHEIQSGRLTITYQKNGISGEYELFDISHYLRDFSSFPQAVIQ